MAEVSRPHARPPVAYAFPLATFHVCVLVLVFVALSYPDLAGIADLNTLIGLVVFGLLWVVSYYGTAWALSDVRVHAVDVAMRRGIGGGVRSGIVLVIGGLLPTLVFASITDPLAALFILAVYGTIGVLVGAIVGGAIGFAFSLVDWVILNLAGLGDGWESPLEAESTES